jgi:hypothetical protein
MDIRWIDDLLRLNTRIIAVEIRLIARVTDHVVQEAHGQDTTKAECLLIADRQMLCLLRRLRDVMLDEIVS